MKNEFLIYIKLLAINPETKMAHTAPCNLQPQIAVNLYYYLEEFQRNEDHNIQAYRNAIEEILQKLFIAFKVPMGWLIEMQSIDEFLSENGAFYEPEKKFSNEFFYSPEHNKTDIDVDFIYQWSLVSFHGVAEGEM